MQTHLTEHLIGQCFHEGLESRPSQRSKGAKKDGSSFSTVYGLDAELVRRERADLHHVLLDVGGLRPS